MKRIVLLLCLVVSGFPLFAQTDFERHNFSMNAGYAYKFASDHTYVFGNMTDKSHSDGLKHGYELEFDYDYRFHKYFSVGFKASMANFLHSFDADIIASDGSVGNAVSCSDDMNLFYVGPTFKFQLPTMAERYDVWARATVGYMNMRNTSKQVQSNTYQGDCFAYGLGIGVDYILTRFISVGLSADFLGGNISALDAGDDSFDISSDKENIGRMNIAFGVRIRL